jgi:hypothetical protein
MRPHLRVPLRYLWQAQRGFRLRRAQNRAILAARGTYLIVTDGDCLPPRWLVARHRRAARPGCYISSRYFRFDAEATQRVTVEAVQTGRAMSVPFLWKLRVRSDWLPRFVLPYSISHVRDLTTKSMPQFNGCNCGVWRSDAIAVNGFEERTVYGGGDLEFGERLERAGIRCIQAKHRLPILHLEHERPYRTPGDIEYNLAIRAEGQRRARVGLQELTVEDTDEGPLE